MPSRVGNKKSRRGCKRCKQRKVKCDEQLPNCGWCKAHSLPCEYAVVGPRGTKNGTDTIVPTSTAPATETTPEKSPQSLDEDSHHHLLELSLFHYYIVYVTLSFPIVEREQTLDIHVNKVPQAALRCPSLRYTMYSYALLHMHVEYFTSGKLPRNADFFEKLGVRMPKTTDQSASFPSSNLLVFHRHYLDCAIQDQRQAILHINEENADGVVMSCILMAMTALVHDSQQSVAAEENNFSYSIPLQWFTLSCSIGSCMRAAQPLMAADSATNTLIAALPVPDKPHFDPLGSSPFRHIVAWQSPTNPEHYDEATAETYQISLAYIEDVYKHVVANERWEMLGRRIMAFPPQTTDLFIKFLEEGRPRALVMLATLLAMAKKLDKNWWIFRGVAEYHVKGIASLIPEEWKWALDWPLLFISQAMPD